MRYNHDSVISEITSLPGCDQIAVLHNTWVPLDLRGKGFGGEAHVARLEEVKHLGYDLALCTINANNKAEMQILLKNGWKWSGFGFRSSKTDHIVELWVRAIDQTLPPPKCPKHPKCQEEYEYCTCASKAGWECQK